MREQVWLVIKEEQVFEDGIPTGEYLQDEYEGVFATREEAFNTCRKLADAYFGLADYVSEISGGWGFYAEKRVDDEYMFWKSYKLEPVNSYM